MGRRAVLGDGCAQPELAQRELAELPREAELRSSPRRDREAQEIGPATDLADADSMLQEEHSSGRLQEAARRWQVQQVRPQGFLNTF